MGSNKVLSFIFIFSVGILSFAKASTSDSSTYTAGVVEFSTTFYDSLESRLKQNLQEFQDLMKKYIKPDDEVDIIIFPEYTLNYEETAIFVNDPNVKIVPCNQKNSNQDILPQLSCLAKEYKKYIVFNIVEKENCNVKSQEQKYDRRPCAMDGLSLYNTNVVFDRKGTLIAKYRKWNLYDELLINTTTTAEFVTFKTDFGVEFASIISFDILWWTPVMELVEKGYKNFIHPMYWYSELPFTTANQIITGYAYAANINILSAGGSYAKEGTTGSAIYNGRRGPIVSKMMPKPTSEILIAKVPKWNKNMFSQQNISNNEIQPRINIFPERLRGLSLYRDSRLDSYRNVLLKPDSLITKEILCNNKFCCTFSIVRKQLDVGNTKTHYSYRLVAFSGSRKYNATSKIKWMKTCAVIACTDDKSIKSCGKIFDDNVEYLNTHYFKSIVIKTNFIKQEKMLIMPNTVDAMMKTIPVNAYNFSTIDTGKVNFTVMKLIRPISDLITFGIFADYYEGFERTYRRKSSGSNTGMWSFNV